MGFIMLYPWSQVFNQVIVHFPLQNLMCRQKDLIDLRSGLIIRTLDDFVKTKHYVTAAISHNEKYILIGEENVSLEITEDVS